MTTDIYGLVLAGGKSTRMGTDKGMVTWHGKPQRYYMADLLASRCKQVYISCRPDQVTDIADGYATIADDLSIHGPMAGILSAFQFNNSVAWLVVACDLPLLDSFTLDYLISNRDSKNMATTFQSPHDGLPEPLITIWEPSAKTAVEAMAEQGFKCPRKVLIHGNTQILIPPSPTALMNVNTPKDAVIAETTIADLHATR